MAIKLRLKDVVQAYPALEQIGTLELPAKTAYRVGRMIDKIRGDAQQYEKQRVELVKKHGEQKSNGDWELKKDPESMQAFESELTALLEETEVVVDYDPIPLSLFVRKQKDKDGNLVDVEVEIPSGAFSRCMALFAE